jgi:hypothetical protein
MRTAVVRWRVVDKGDGVFDVTRNNRRMIGSVSFDSAQDYLRRAGNPGEKFFLEESDGYLTPLVLSSRRQTRRKR